MNTDCNFCALSVNMFFLYDNDLCSLLFVLLYSYIQLCFVVVFCYVCELCSYPVHCFDSVGWETERHLTWKKILNQQPHVLCMAFCIPLGDAA